MSETMIDTAMNEMNIKESMTKCNVSCEVAKILGHKMPVAEYNAMIMNEIAFMKFGKKVNEATKTIIEKYNLKYSTDCASYFCALAETMRKELLTREDSIEMYQNLDKLYEFFDRVEKVFVLKES